MKRLYFPILTLFIFSYVFVSCSKLDSYSLSKAQERIYGTWTVKEVRKKVNGDGKWCKIDVTGNYKDISYRFEENGVLLINVPNESVTMSGYWYLYEDISWNEEDQEQEVTFKLYGYAEHPDSAYLYRELYWEKMKVSSTVFEAQETKYNGSEKVTYYYTLKR